MRGPVQMQIVPPSIKAVPKASMRPPRAGDVNRAREYRNQDNTASGAKPLQRTCRAADVPIAARIQGTTAACPEKLPADRVLRIDRYCRGCVQRGAEPIENRAAIDHVQAQRAAARDSADGHRIGSADAADRRDDSGRPVCRRP